MGEKFLGLWPFKPNALSLAIHWLKVRVPKSYYNGSPSGSFQKSMLAEIKSGTRICRQPQDSHLASEFNPAF